MNKEENCKLVTEDMAREALLHPADVFEDS